MRMMGQKQLSEVMECTLKPMCPIDELCLIFMKSHAKNLED